MMRRLFPAGTTITQVSDPRPPSERGRDLLVGYPEVEHAFPAGVPHQLCHFHYLREAARPIYEADRHAKKELKKRVRGIRPIERQVEKRQDPQAEAIRGYCSAVRSATGPTPDRQCPGTVVRIDSTS